MAYKSRLINVILIL